MVSRIKACARVSIDALSAVGRSKFVAMANTLKDNLKDLKHTLSAKFKVNKYHNNLLGESLEDLIRKATAKTVYEPDDELNQQVVYAINSEAHTTHTPKEIVNILKKRLTIDNCHKQYLATALVGKVLQECSSVLAGHQEELLQAVAGAMARPARRGSEESGKLRRAGMDLLRQYGRAGQEAFRAAAAVRPEFGQVVRAPLPANGVQDAATINAEAESILDEIQRMVDFANGHVELLTDLLVNTGDLGDFETGLVKDLVPEVRELRDNFTLLLEQLGAMNGPRVEKLMCEALSAVDRLDEALGLEKDVLAAAKEAAATGAPFGAAPAPAAAATLASAGPSAAPAAAAGGGDLIDLNDLEEALPPAAAVAPARDPFAASGDPFGPPPQWGGAGAAGTSTSVAPSNPFGGAVTSPTHAGLSPAYGQGYAPAAPAYPQYPAPVAAHHVASPTYSGMAVGAPGGPGSPVMSPNNPFAAAAAPNNPFGTAAPAGSVDAQWNMFFNDRLGGATGQASAGQNSSAADFDALVASNRPAAAPSGYGVAPGSYRR